MRYDKSFFSLRLNVSHPFPRLSLVRTLSVVNDHERILRAVFVGDGRLKITLKFIQLLFPLRQCTERALEPAQGPVSIVR